MNDFFKDIRFSSNELSNEVSKSLGLGRECDNGGLQGQAFKNHMHILFPIPNEHNLGGDWSVQPRAIRWPYAYVSVTVVENGLRR